MEYKIGIAVYIRVRKKTSFGGQSPPNFVLVQQLFCVGGPGVHQTSGGHQKNFVLYNIMS